MQWMASSAICVEACSLPLTYVMTRSRKHIVKAMLHGELIDAEYSLLSMDLASGFTEKAVSTRGFVMIKIIFAGESLQIWEMLENARCYCAALKNSAITTRLLTHRKITPVTTRMITKTLKSAIGLMRVVPWGSAGFSLQYAQFMPYSWSNCLSKH